MDTRETYAVFTVRMPMVIARPVVKAQLKKENCSADLLPYVKKINAVKVTVAATRPGFDMMAFRTMATKKPYQNWATVNAYGNMLYINAVEKKGIIRKLNIVVAAKENAVAYVMLKCKLSPDELSECISLLMSDEKIVKKWIGGWNRESKKEL
jgi:hypothetical protein